MSDRSGEAGGQSDRPSSPPSPASLIERILAQGTLGLSEERAAEICRALSKSEDADLERLVRNLSEGRAPPAALVGALESSRLHALAHLAPPRLDPGLRGKRRDRWLGEINRVAGAAPPGPPPRGHVLSRLAAFAPHETLEPVMRLDDVPVLWCLVRSGRIAERRAAVRRLGALISEGELGDGGFDVRDLIAGLGAIRDPLVAFEVDEALAGVAGAAGRTARQRLARADKLLAQVGARARRYWAGDEEADPLDQLSREESLRLGVWLRRAPDLLAAHVAEYLQAGLGRGDPSGLADAVGAFIPSGDDRLVPVLCRLLPDGPLGARIATARALGRIADPRVHRALIKAYRHAGDVTEKTVIGGSLGQYGDDRALEFLLERLDDDEPMLWEEAIRSLGSIGCDETASRLIPLLESDRPALVQVTARALIRCGGPSALDALRAMSRRKPQQATVLGDAAEALALRLQLLGVIPEDEVTGEAGTVPPSRALASRTHEDLEPAPPEALGPPLSVKLKSLGYYLWGVFWALIWQRSRALEAFEAAARLHRGAPTPHLREAMLHAASGRDDLALESFRRALEANKRWVLRRQVWVERLLRAFLRRADHLVARRRKREALRLLDEVSSLDLSAADLDLRLAVSRRRDRLLVDRTRRRVSHNPERRSLA